MGKQRLRSIQGGLAKGKEQGFPHARFCLPDDDV